MIGSRAELLASVGLVDNMLRCYSKASRNRKEKGSAKVVSKTDFVSMSEARSSILSKSSIASLLNLSDHLHCRIRCPVAEAQWFTCGVEPQGNLFAVRYLISYFGETIHGPSAS